MKSILLTALVLIVSVSTAMAEQFKNVTVCAAECSSESLGVYPMGQALVGKIYFADATEENRKFSGVCLSNSKSVVVVTNRMTDDSLNACADAMLGKYYGQIVEINTETQRSEEDADLGTYLSIKARK